MRSGFLRSGPRWRPDRIPGAAAAARCGSGPPAWAAWAWTSFRANIATRGRSWRSASRAICCAGSLTLMCCWRPRSGSPRWCCWCTWRTASAAPSSNSPRGSRSLPRAIWTRAWRPAATTKSAAPCGPSTTWPSACSSSTERLVYLTQLASWQTLARKMAHEVKNSLTPIRLTVEEMLARYGDARPRLHGAGRADRGGRSGEPGAPRPRLLAIRRRASGAARRRWISTRCWKSASRS